MEGALVMERVVEAEFTEGELRTLRDSVTLARQFDFDTATLNRLGRLDHLLALRIEECYRGDATVWRIESEGVTHGRA